MPSISLFTLIASNLIPLIGVLFFGWSGVLMLAVFWIENLIIGVFNLLKIVTLSIFNRRLNDLFIACFFILHYGVFWSAHGSFLWDILALPEQLISNHLAYSVNGLLDIFLEGMRILLAFVNMFGAVIILSILALVLSHTVSFVENFILAGGIFTLNAKSLMSKPYAQVIIMHAGLMLGATAIEKFGSTLWLLLIMVAFKLTVDVHQYKRRRQQEQLLPTPDKHHA